MDRTAKERMKRYRGKKRNESVTGNVTVSPNSVTEGAENVTLDVTQYPAIIHALADPDKRRKLEKVYQSLRDFKREKDVHYGLPYNGISFDIAGELLEATR